MSDFYSRYYYIFFFTINSSTKFDLFMYIFEICDLRNGFCNNNNLVHFIFRFDYSQNKTNKWI